MPRGYADSKPLIVNKRVKKDKVITAEAAAAATLRLTLVPSTNLSLKAAASVRLSLALSRPSVIYKLT